MITLENMAAVLEASSDGVAHLLKLLTKASIPVRGKHRKRKSSICQSGTRSVTGIIFERGEMVVQTNNLSIPRTKTISKTSYV